MTIYNCFCCGKECTHARSLAQHVSSHKLTSREYYDLYLRKEGEGMCLCGKPTEWDNITKGYRKHCSNKCSSPTSMIKQWSGEKGINRKTKLSEKMIGNNFSVGRPIGSSNVNPYPRESALKRSKTSPPPSWSGKTHSIITKEKMSLSAYERIRRIGLPKPKQGIFRPQNPSKYRGNVDNIVYRSSWELKFFKYCDQNSNIVFWSSEEVQIPYISPKDSRYHRYFPDVLIGVKQRDGTIKNVLIEIKPHKETYEPKVQKRKTSKYINEVLTWGVNQSKWKAAEEYCQDRGWKFQILTEYDLGIKKLDK